MVRSIGCWLVVALVTGCESSPSATPDLVLSPDIGGGQIEAGVDLSPADLPVTDGAPACVADEIRCEDTTHQQVCQAGAWVTEACPSGTLCLDGACSAECIDQCNLGATRTVGGQTETCQLFSVAQNKTVDLSDGLHDRAREHNMWIRDHYLPAGALAKTSFSDTTYTTPAAHHSTGDSAIWTGTYLAAEALRHKATGSPDAEKNMEALVEVIHRLFEVTGHPGFMARYAAPINHPDPLVQAIYLPNEPYYHKVTYKGQDFFWRGHTSRDQYQGVLLGYALAYEALTSATHRKMIRDDMVALCTELLKERKDLPVTIRFYALGQWFELPLKVDVQYTLLNPSESKNGGIYIQLGSDSDPSDYAESELEGIQEFMPDVSPLLKQLPGLGALITFPVPRSGSAVMLASIMQIGMMVTDGVPGLEATHKAIEAHYSQHVGTWLALMKQYVHLNGAAQCWESYYGLNIVFQPVYNMVRLESDPTLRASFQQDVLAGKLWPVVQSHKNVFFTYVHASQAPASPALTSVITGANAQLAQFPPPPQAAVSVDNSGKYTANPDCPDQTTEPVDVADRKGDFFIWQRHPFPLTYSGNPLLTYPGIDFLLPYWMARHHGFMTDDAAGTCLRWRP